MKAPSGIALAVIAGLAAAVVLSNRPSHGSEGRSGVEFYLLKNNGLDFETARQMPLEELVLRDEPWIASGDILRYDWSSHW